MKSIRRNKRPPLKLAIGHGLCLMLICVLTISSAFLFFASPVQAAIYITTSPLLPQGQVGVPYYTVLTATGDNPPFTWSYSGPMPPGLNLAPSGVISGTPTMAGTFNLAAIVTDSTAATTSQTFVITITQPPLSFLTTSLTMAKEGETYTDIIRVSGGTTPYTFTVLSGILPTGLIINASNGYISGVPDKGTAGSYSFIVQVKDSSTTPITGQQSLSILVQKGGYEATISIGNGLKAGQTKLYVGTALTATLKGGESTKIKLDLDAIRTISVDPTVQHPTDSGVRFKAEMDKVTITESSHDVTFPYYTEYSIELKTEPSTIGQISGAGWYKENYTLRATPPDEVNDPSAPGTQYRFAYWKLPTGETVSGRDLSLTINAAGTCTAYYDTYYRLTLTSPYGDAEGSDWYKKGSTAEWSMTDAQEHMPGILGIFGGKLNAVNASDSTLMDGPKTINIDWEPDYTMPFILIPATIILLILGGYGLYLLLRSLQPKPIPMPPPYQYMPPPPPPQPIPPPQTTVVMIGGDKPKLGPGTTREQLMEKFGELLQIYENEIKSTAPGAALPEARTVKEEKRLAAPGPTQPTEEEAEATSEEEIKTCTFIGKKPLRTVASAWKQLETRTITPPATDKKAAEGMTGLAINWIRYIYQEWEILNCWLPRKHKEPHEGSVEIVYSLINTITEENTYAPGQELTPPSPHYTEGMPLVEVSAAEIITPDKLPPKTIS